jgi:hypothetical protein
MKLPRRRLRTGLAGRAVYRPSPRGLAGDLVPGGRNPNRRGTRLAARASVLQRVRTGRSPRPGRGVLIRAGSSAGTRIPRIPCRSPWPPMSAQDELGGWACDRQPRAVSISNISVANKVAGSLTGSQRPQARGHVRPRPASLATAGTHVRRYHATPRDVTKMPPKQ